MRSKRILPFEILIYESYFFQCTIAPKLFNSKLASKCNGDVCPLSDMSFVEKNAIMDRCGMFTRQEPSEDITICKHHRYETCVKKNRMINIE